MGALCATYLTGAVKADGVPESKTEKSSAMDAVITACAVLGICGKLSETEQGSGSFMTNLMNTLSILKDADIEKYLDVEERTIEGL